MNRRQVRCAGDALLAEAMDDAVAIDTARKLDDVDKPGALMVGIVEAFSSFYASNFKEVIVFTLIVPVLLLRSLAAPAVEEEKD